MSNSKFVYALYIAATPEKVWKALLDGELTRQYWGHENVSDWKPGSPWKHVQRRRQAHRQTGGRSRGNRSATPFGTDLG